MTDDDRALIGIERRRGDRGRATPYAGSAIVEDDDDDRGDGDDFDEDTSPFDLLDREPNESELEVVHRLRRDSAAPITTVDFVKFVESQKRKNVKHRSANREIERQLVELLRTPPNQATAALQSDMVTVKKRLRFARGIAVAAISAALASLGGWAKWYWDRAQAEATSAAEIAHLKEDLGQMRMDLREDRKQKP